MNDGEDDGECEEDDAGEDVEDDGNGEDVEDDGAGEDIEMMVLVKTLKMMVLVKTLKMMAMVKTMVIGKTMALVKRIVMKSMAMMMNRMKKYYSHLQPEEYSISHQPAATVRIQGDGNCFFRALAFVVTGSQDEHLELRAIATSYMQHNAEICHATLMLIKQWTSI